MHELAVTRELVGLILRECKKIEMKNPRQIVLELGELTTYTEESLRFYFDMLKMDEPTLRKTKLVIKKIPICCSCRKCGKESILREILQGRCPGCGSDEIGIVSGRELVLKSIEG